MLCVQSSTEDLRNREQQLAANSENCLHLLNMHGRKSTTESLILVRNKVMFKNIRSLFIDLQG